MVKKIKMTDRCTKKVLGKIDEMGWHVNPTWDDVFRYLMDVRDIYVMPLPMEGHKWEVGLVILGHPNVNDNMLNRCSLKEGLSSYEEAMRYGIEQAVDSSYRAFKLVRKATLRGEYDKLVEENYQACIDAGFKMD